MEPITLTLNSSDNVRVHIDSKSANKSGLLKGLLVDYIEDSGVIPMPDIKGDVLEKVVEYLTYYQDKDPREISKPLPSANLLDVTDEWDVTFINSIDIAKTFDLIIAANYMDIRSLLDLACARIASIMKGVAPEELQKMLNIENDLSEEEMKEYEEYQI